MKKIFTFLIVLLPILGQYKSPIPKMELATFSILCLIPFIMTSEIRKVKYTKNTKKIRKVFLLFCAYIIVSTVISVSLQNNDNFSIVLRSGKFVFLIVFVICMYYENLFDIDYGIKILKNITLIASLYIIVQTICFYVLHMTLPGIIPNLVEQGEYDNLSYGYAKNLALFRPTSFFLEPSMFSEYVIVYLVYVLFNENGRNTYLQAIIITIGIICSTSGSGYVYCFLAWGMFLYKKFMTNITSKKILVIVFITLLGICFAPKLLNISIVNKSIQRGIDGSETGGNAFLGRVSSLEFYNELNGIYKIIGMGYGNPVDGKFMNSLSYVMYCCGVVGIILLVYLFYSLLKFKSCNKGKNAFIIIWICSLFFSTTFVATKICFYIVFLLMNNRMIEGEDINENNIYINSLLQR